MLDLLIIGSGPVGLYSAFLAGAKKLKTEVIESLGYVGGQLTTLYPEKPIYDVPGIQEIKAKDLIKELYKQYLPFEKEVPIHYNTSLLNIEKEEVSAPLLPYTCKVPSSSIVHFFLFQ